MTECTPSGQKFIKDYVKLLGQMIDTGATSHIITDILGFKKFNKELQSDFIELADGRCSGVAKQREDAEVVLIDSKEGRHKTTLTQALYIFTDNFLDVQIINVRASGVFNRCALNCEAFIL